MGKSFPRFRMVIFVQATVFLPVALRVFLIFGAKHQVGVPFTVDVCTQWRFIAGCGVYQLPLPVTRLAPWIVVPLAFFTRKAYPDHVRPSVAVDVVGEVEKGIAPFPCGIECLGRPECVLVPVRRFKPVRTI